MPRTTPSDEEKASPEEKALYLLSGVVVVDDSRWAPVAVVCGPHEHDCDFCPHYQHDLDDCDTFLEAIRTKYEVGTACPGDHAWIQLKPEPSSS